MSQFAVPWIYVLDNDYVYDISAHLPKNWNESYIFVDRSKQPRLQINAKGEARILAGYAWDGCSPKFSVFDILIGTPDGVPNKITKKPKTYYASLLHDTLYQFLDAELPLQRADADQIFLELLTRDHFAPKHVYYTAVRVFGGIFRQFTRVKRKYAGKRIPFEDR